MAPRPRLHTLPRPSAARTNTRLRLFLRPSSGTLAPAESSLGSSSRRRLRRRQKQSRPSHHPSLALTRLRRSSCLTAASNPHLAIFRAFKSPLRCTCLTRHMDSTITSSTPNRTITSTANSAPPCVIPSLRRRRHCRRCPKIWRASRSSRRSARRSSRPRRVVRRAPRARVRP